MNILVVDDSKTMRFVMVKMLKELGYKYINDVENCQKALFAIKNEKPALILSDWNMPDGSGLDLLKTVRNDTSSRNIPFIMFTTEKDQQKILEASKAGLQSYLLKPVRKEVLEEKLKTLASAYGFDPPYFNKSAVKAEEPPPDEELELLKSMLKGTLKDTDVSKIIQQCLNGINDQCEEMVAKEIFGSTFEEKGDEAKLLLRRIRDVAFKAISGYLGQFL
jgi:two-component system, chemotaxis family, chemotaxis protein CheY